MFKPSGDVATYAKIAEAAYSPSPPQVIDGLRFLSNLSNDRIKVYYDNSVGGVVGIRGTKVTNVNDLIADYNIIRNTLRQDLSYKQVRDQVKTIINTLGKVILSGHSLGGAMVIELLTEFPNQIEAAYVFNSGIGLRKFISDMATKLMCKVVPFTRKCKELKLIRQKLHVFTTGKDPISFLSRFAPSDNVSLIKPLSSNIHGISNFTQLATQTRKPNLLDTPNPIRVPTNDVVEAIYNMRSPDVDSTANMGADNATAIEVQ
jgi:pimeloyl-ACP methyl ester carboxylesterase